MPARLLVVDSDSRYGDWLRHHLGVLCPDAVVSVLSHDEFERWRDELSGRDCDVLLLAAAFGSGPEDPGSHGLALLRQLRDKPEFPAVIAVAVDGNELTAVRALRLGAADYLPKRLLTPERLKNSVRLALRQIEKRVARRLASLAEVAPPAAAANPSSTAASNESTASLEAVAAPPVATAPPAAGASAETGPPASSAGAPPASGSSASAPRAGVPPAAAATAPEPGSEAAGSAPREEHTSPALPTFIPAGSAAAPGGERMPSDFIPGYTIHATLGESEKAAVYVATSASLGHKVALKISKTLRDEAAGRQFLEREYTAIVAIRSPSVVRIYDYGVHAGYEYLVMEYLARGDLKARMQLGLTEQEALEYFERIASALQVVHQAGLLHRDLKPPNVMLRDNGDVALIDFGLARALDGSTPSTRVGVLRGSPYYMSPEQALGETLDARSDFYSLGIMFYEMLTGRKPYTGGSAMDVLQQHVNAPPPQLPRTLAHYEPLLDKLLAKSREQRFANTLELLAAVGAVRAAATRVESTAA